MEKEHIEQLLHHYLEGSISDSDRRSLEKLVIGNQDPDAVVAALQAMLKSTEGYPPQVPSGWEAIPDAITSIEKQTGPVIRRIYTRRWWAAASIVLALATGAYLWTSSKKNTQQPALAQQTVDILPGKDGAVLTLADGKQVSLDSIQTGIVALQGGVTARVVNGTLQYEGRGTEAVYNTMSTPKGRQYHLTLPDGTRVWLNAASSIRYPTVFNGNKRSVVISGEVYFEVAKNTKIPFLVNTNNKATVEVLGTHFNVNAYENENAILTTLLEGVEKVNGTILRPGQQAQLLVGEKTRQGIAVIDKADTGKVMAWKNGNFNFEDASLEEILRQLERWYNIEVIYENGIPQLELSGEMTRAVSLNMLLTVLKKMGLNYRVEGRTLYVLQSAGK